MDRTEGFKTVTAMGMIHAPQRTRSDHMTFDAALTKEQGVSFAVVCVKKSLLNNKIDARKHISRMSSFFGGVPVVLMGQDSRGIPEYYGRTDIVNFLANVHPARLPWRRYN